MFVSQVSFWCFLFLRALGILVFLLSDWVAHLCEGDLFLFSVKCKGRGGGGYLVSYSVMRKDFIYIFVRGDFGLILAGRYLV